MVGLKIASKKGFIINIVIVGLNARLGNSDYYHADYKRTGWADFYGPNTLTHNVLDVKTSI